MAVAFLDAQEAAAARRGLDGRTTELCEKLEAVARAVEAGVALWMGRGAGARSVGDAFQAL